MSVTEVTEESYFSRLGGAIKGVLTGIVIFILAFPLLFWNEGRAVKRARALEAGAESVISVQSDKVDPKNDGKLIHTSGDLATEDILTDPQFNISQKAIMLSRKVEMYQWKENTSQKKEKQLGGSVKTTTTYTYSKDWYSSPINSSKFKEEGHDNPGTFPFTEQTWYAKKVTMNAFQLSEELIRKVGKRMDFDLPKDYKAADTHLVSGNTIYIPKGEGRNPASEPVIGDVRITYQVIYPHMVSIIGEQSAKTIVPHAIKGDTILLLKDAKATADEMFQDAQDANAMLTWFLRIIGFAMMYIGLSMVLKPLSVLADLIPFIGDLIEVGTGIIAFLVALPLTLITIAIAWLFYRPLIAIPLLIVAGGAIFWLIKKKKEAAAKKAETEAAA